MGFLGDLTGGIATPFKAVGSLVKGGLHTTGGILKWGTSTVKGIVDDARGLLRAPGQLVNGIANNLPMILIFGSVAGVLVMIMKK